MIPKTQGSQEDGETAQNGDPKLCQILSTLFVVLME